MNGTFRFGTFRVEGLELLDNSNVLVTLVSGDPSFPGRIEVEMDQAPAAGFRVGGLFDIETQLAPAYARQGSTRPEQEIAKQGAAGWGHGLGCTRGCSNPSQCNGSCNPR